MDTCTRLAAIEDMRAQFAQTGLGVVVAMRFEGEKAFDRALVVGREIGAELFEHRHRHAMGPAATTDETRRRADHAEAGDVCRRGQRRTQRHQTAQ